MKAAHGFVLLVCFNFILVSRDGFSQKSPRGRTEPLPSSTIEAGSLRGVVVDPSGAVVVGADITLEPVPATPPAQRFTRTAGDGRYSLAEIPPGTYHLRVVAKGFAVFESEPLRVSARRLETVNVQLSLDSAKAQVDVSGDDAEDTDPNRNADSVRLPASAIHDLPVDPAALDQEIRSLSNGDSPVIYLDNFSGASIPPRDTIREIRINQNPYSARNDTDPSSGLVEIFTKPGTEKLRATFFTAGSDSAFDSPNPFIQQQPPFYFTQQEGGLSGSLNQSMSYFVNFFHRIAAGNAIIDAETLDSNLNPIEHSEALSSPLTNNAFSPRIDLQRGDKATVDLRYSWSSQVQSNAGIDQLSLADQAYHSQAVTQIFQASNSRILSAHIVNDARIQYVRARTAQTPVSAAPTLNVQGAFISGGNSTGASHDNQDRFDIQNLLDVQAGKHSFSPGVRIRLTRDANVSTANYNGQFVFPTIQAYQSAARTLAQCAQLYAAAQCTAPGATQFTIATGTPAATVTVADLAAFYQDDWKVRPQFTLSYGLRYELQNHLAGLGNLAPRIAFAWGIKATDKRPPRLVFRVGSGIFYTRLGSSSILQAQRQNGISQLTYVVANPAFYPLIPSPAALGPQVLPTIFRISRAFHSPYTWNNTISLERPLGNRGALSFSYVYGRGVHLALTRNINSPLPGTYAPDDPTSGIRPFGTTQNINQYESAGVARSNRLFASASYRGKHDSYFYSSYTFRLAKTDVPPGFPSDEYNLAADYGRAPVSTHTFTLQANGPVPLLQLHVSSFLNVTSGAPFNITVGQDLNGDSQFNDRPAFATDLSRPSVVPTSYGALDTNPTPGQTIIPVNYGNGPAQVITNLQVYRNFTFGPPPGDAIPAGTTSAQGTPGRYNLLLGIEGENPINHVNLDKPVGVAGSPLFGTSTALAGGATSDANRVINLLLEFRF